MNALAKNQKEDIDFIKATINDTKLHRLLEDVIDSTHAKVYEDGYPLLKSYPPSAFWHWSIAQAKGALRDMGFVLDPECGNQYRLLSVDEYEYPVRVRFAKGLVKEGTAIFSAEKGSETKKGLIQNQQYFSSQEYLIDEVRPRRMMPKEFNLWVLYQIEPKFVTVWLALCLDSLSGTRVPCQDFALICSKPMGNLPPIVDIVPKIDDGGYGIQLGEKDDVE